MKRLTDVEWDNYYTPAALASLVASLAGNRRPRAVVDICAGSWNLLRAVAQRWPESQYVGVDLAGCRCTSGLPLNSTSIIRDGRLFAEESVAGGHRFDLVVANPPFGKEAERAEIRRAVEGIGGIDQHLLSSTVLKRIEANMLLCNAALVRDGGSLVAVVPITVVGGERFRAIRQSLASRFEVKSITHLPDNMFGAGIRTAVVVLRRVNSREDTVLMRANLTRDGIVTVRSGILKKADVSVGVWEPLFGNTGLTDGVSIVRGQVPSNEFVDAGQVVVHSSSVRRHGSLSRDRCRFVSSEGVRNGPPAQVKPGDMLVVRIGKKLGLSMRVRASNIGYASDHLFIVRCRSSALRERVWNLLKQEETPRLLRSRSRGLAVRYLTASDLRAFISQSLTR